MVNIEAKVDWLNLFLNNNNKGQQNTTQTGRILAREGAAIPTYPSLVPEFWRTMLVTLLPNSQCQTPTSFSGRKTFSISIDPDMKHIEPVTISVSVAHTVVTCR